MRTSVGVVHLACICAMASMGEVGSLLSQFSEENIVSAWSRRIASRAPQSTPARNVSPAISLTPTRQLVGDFHAQHMSDNPYCTGKKTPGEPGVSE